MVPTFISKKSYVLLPHSPFMPIVPEFPYLGDMVARDGSSDGSAVDRRILKAGKAFGALRKCIFSTIRNSPTDHGQGFEALWL